MDRLDGSVYHVDNAHNGIINAIDTAGCIENRGASEIVTGGQDGLVKVWDPRCNEAVVQIESTVNVSFETFSWSFSLEISPSIAQPQFPLQPSTFLYSFSLFFQIGQKLLT